MAKSVNIKAIIKHCQHEGGDVVYFKSGKRFFKMTSKKDVRLSSYNSIGNMTQSWKKESIKCIVYEDEQVLLDGKPIHLTNTMMKIKSPMFDFLGIEYV